APGPSVAAARLRGQRPDTKRGGRSLPKIRPGPADTCCGTAPAWPAAGTLARARSYCNTLSNLSQLVDLTDCVADLLLDLGCRCRRIRRVADRATHLDRIGAVGEGGGYA